MVKKSQSKIPASFVWREEAFYFECPHCKEVNRLETRPNEGFKVACDYCDFEDITLTNIHE